MAFEFLKKKKKIEATRATVDPLSPNVTESYAKQIDKNNFTSYEQQIEQIYQGYFGTLEYSSALIRTIVDTRTAFIVGDGLSVASTEKKVQAFLDKIIFDNDLYSSSFLRMVQTGEMEGKILILLEKSQDKIILKPVSYRRTKYKIIKDSKNNIVSCILNYGVTQKETVIPKGKFIYIQLYGDLWDINLSPPKTANVLTQIENFDRALYDLRHNNHLFGKSIPIFETKTFEDAKMIKKIIDVTDWTLGKSIATPAKTYMLEPTGRAYESVQSEMSLNIKIISTITGIPVHWLGWTDLMSNRSTAETLVDLIDNATKTERLSWTSGIKQLINLAMEMSVDSGFDWGVYDADNFVVDLPQSSKYRIKDIQEVWLPLRDGGHISETTFLNKIPGVNPEQERKNLMKEGKDQQKVKQLVAEDIKKIIDGREEDE